MSRSAIVSARLAVGIITAPTSAPITITAAETPLDEELAPVVALAREVDAREDHDAAGPG